MRDWIGMIRRGIRKPPKVIVKRIASELHGEMERLLALRRQCLKLEALLAEVEASDLRSLWEYLASRPYPAVTGFVASDVYAGCCPGGEARIVARAENALVHRVDMLGSGVVELGENIDWLTDFRSGVRWPPAYFSDINFSSPDDAGDVKVPWELSRLQWLIPLGQAYCLTRDGRYAQGAREIVEHWIDHNPYAATVNWSSTMEVALRILSMTWLFHVFHATQAWGAADFREKFLRSLFLHVDFTERHTISSEVNAGIYTVSAAGLVYGGLFFGKGRAARRWLEKGWQICSGEITRQIHADGTDFEGAVSYHRLAMEFFLLPALYRQCHDHALEPHYRERLLAMARYVATYTRPDGLAPLLGDDGGTRALPFDDQDVNDHRFMIGQAGAGLRDAEVSALFAGPRAEVFWSVGAAATATLPEQPAFTPSRALAEGGYFVMRSATDHVFIDCAPVGLAGRGGHGHNDCLSFEAMLDGVALFTDRGTLTYSASFSERNAFRATASHGTPCVDDEEINRFTDPNWLWSLHYDAVPELVEWKAEADHALFIGRHRGYQRLSRPVLPERLLLADFACHALYLMDRFTGEGAHRISEPLHLAPGVEVAAVASDHVRLVAGGKAFLLRWNGDADFMLRVEPSRVSPAYGVAVESSKLVWTREGYLAAPFAMLIAPEQSVDEADAAMCHRVEHYGLAWAL